MAHKGLASISELHRATGIDRETITKRLTAAGLVPEDTSRGAKRFNREVALAALESQAGTEDQAKRRKMIADAEKAELNVSKLRGELVSVEEMKKAAGELVKTLYQRIVRVEPSIIAAKCVGKNALEIEGVVRDQLAIVFAELRSMPENFLSVENEDESSG